ncbi:hypothetical protein DsansV1_C32g0221481 [Dioscorea sansibarensis]
MVFGEEDGIPNFWAATEVSIHHSILPTVKRLCKMFSPPYI